MQTNPFEGLDRTFHEPKRLAIMSALSARQDGLTFSDLKRECHLTDGNLNRHLKTLMEADAVISRKRSRSKKMQTRMYITAKGRKEFAAYLASLETVLSQAVQTLAPQQDSKARPAAVLPTPLNLNHI